LKTDWPNSPSTDTEKYKQYYSYDFEEIFLPTAFVFINTEPAAMPEVLKKVKAIEGVEEAGMVYGVYDIVARVKTETMDKLKHIITYKIRTIADIRATQTVLVVP